ncbi:Spo0E family sporulation regulatory protein-aspartic acid phosphatase [Alteribacillus sp. HJP-4]|uniref:Spo0E family sporulation regulatory protein-aspartic acid phosphatase n=1 Tax=Alteribacillus sp. HJP-4 TaxID=2775394 RepID=UPI0035CCF02E
MEMIYNKFKLLSQIQVKKREMYRKAKQYGLTDARVVACSQELDTLLNTYQKIQFKRVQLHSTLHQK